MKSFFVMIMMVMVMLCGGCNTATTVDSRETEAETEFRFYVLREDGSKDYGTSIAVPTESYKERYVIGDDGCVQLLIDDNLLEEWEIPELEEGAQVFKLNGDKTFAVQNGKEVWLLLGGAEEPWCITSRGHIVTYSVSDETVTSFLYEGKDGELHMETLGLNSYHITTKVVDDEGVIDASILDSFISKEEFIKDGEHYTLQIRAHRPRSDSGLQELEYSFKANKL